MKFLLLLTCLFNLSSQAFEMEVSAHRYWQNTGHYISGESQISVSIVGGRWSFGYNQAFIGALGHNYPFDGCPLGSLVGKIGLAQKVKKICLGKDQTINVRGEGFLFVAMNDGVLEDNSGSLLIDLKVTKSLESSPIHIDEIERIKNRKSKKIELYSDHVSLVLPKEYIENNLKDAPEALRAFDEIYETYEIYSGGHVPYLGQRMRFVEDDSHGGMLSGNPIRFHPTYYNGYFDNLSQNLLKAHRPGFAIWGVAHEMGHNFTFINGGLYNIGASLTEGFANIYNLHFLEKFNRSELNRKTCEANVRNHIMAGNYEDIMKYNWLGLCFLKEFQQLYGSDFFKKFFTWYNSLPSQEISRLRSQLGTDRQKWQWLYRSFNSIAGEDTRKLFELYHIFI